MKAVSVIFGNSPNHYDYWCSFDVKVGDNVVVETKRGEATVIVVEVKDHSEKATAAVKRVAQAEW